MSRLKWAVFLAAILCLAGATSFVSSPSDIEGARSPGDSPSKVEGRAKSEPQANFVGAVLDQLLRTPERKTIGGTAAPAPAEGVFASGIAYATTNNTVSLKLSDLPVGKVIQVGEQKFVKVGEDQYQAINLCPTGSTYMAAYKGCVVKQTDFAYTGGDQAFTAPADGYYVLEVWGAQGSDNYINLSNSIGGYGGYALGSLTLTRNEKLYLQIGGQGERYHQTGSYNGGGASQHSGGGATSVTTTNRGTLKAFVDYQSEVIVVAGGGGGDDTLGYGGHGGGYIGSKSVQTRYSGLTPEQIRQYSADGGTQTAGGDGWQNGSFGQGGSHSGAADLGGGGGGGWYGGGSGRNLNYSSGGGGSGYIGSSKLISLTNFPNHMTCYSCATSTEASTYTISNTCVSADLMMDCSKIGNGAVRITQLSVYLGI